MHDDEHTTRWKNPTPHTVRLSFHRDRGQRRHNVTIEPGKELTLPGEFDSAIHQVHGGVVVGGMAPQLIKVGEEPLPVTSTLGLAEARELAAERGDELEDMRDRMMRFEREGTAAIEEARGHALAARASAESSESELAKAKAKTAELEAELAKLRAGIQGAPDAPAPVDAKPKK